MSAPDCKSVLSELLASAADICSRQWTALGGLSRPLHDEPCKAIVDPEALILLSLVAREEDARLEERLAWWAKVGARHSSVQRIRTLAQSFPAEIARAWKSFAVAAGRHGGASWRAHGGADIVAELPERAHAELDAPRLGDDSTLMLRLRIGFGVNAKADLLAFLIGSPGHRFPASTMAHELAYVETTIKRAARDMARAGLVQEVPGHPIAYSTDRTAWMRLLELDVAAQPPWRPWALMFPFVARAIEWTRLDASTSAYLRASRARDLFEEHRGDLERWDIGAPKPERTPGESFEPAFLAMLSRLAHRMRELA